MRSFPSFALATGLAFVAAATAQVLPEGVGKAETDRLCKQCHEIARAISPRLDRGGWEKSMTKMTAFGMKATDQEYAVVLDYLVKNFPAEEVPRINVNTATAIQLESGLSLKRSQAAAVLAWRKEHGGFKSWEELLKVPGLDAAKLDEKKDRVTF